MYLTHWHEMLIYSLIYLLILEKVNYFLILKSPRHIQCYNGTQVVDIVR